MADTLTTLSYEAVQAHEMKLLYRAQQAQVFYPAGQKTNLRKSTGNSVDWRRFNSLTPTTTALTEGVTPTETALSMSQVTATVAQYGAFVTISDLLDLMGIDPVIAEAMEVFGQHGGESIEKIMVDQIDGGTTVQYATGSARASQAATNIITVAMIRKAVRTLQNNNAQTYNGMTQNDKVMPSYIAFMHPYVIYDLKNDSEWKNHQQYSAPEKLYNGEIGEIEGCRVVQSTLCPKYTGEGSGGADVYGTIFLAQHAIGVVDVAGTGKFQMKAKQLGSGGSSDPLDQRATVGWKSQFVSKILNDNFMVRLETGATA